MTTTKKSSKKSKSVEQMVTVKQMKTGETKQVPASSFDYGSDAKRALIKGGWLVVDDGTPIYAKQKPVVPVISDDAWQSLVLRTMGVDELQRESENVENSDVERASMRAELKKR